ncbi:MAG: DNA glycosylase [Chloroherpetonaceae bacterium]|nr:DNA glycosylase [Chloroherpetonaceae bacterium]
MTCSTPPAFLLQMPGTPCVDLALTLQSGQAFRWRQSADGVWWGTAGESVIALWQGCDGPDGPLFFQTYPEPGRQDLVADYLRLDVDLDALYREWVAQEPAIAPLVRRFRGLRILRQPPEECCFAFLCATFNTVVRIERTVHRLAERYGTRFALPLDGYAPTCYRFPTLPVLAQAREDCLRADGWGFRAPRVIALARFLQATAPGWLCHLRTASYSEARAALRTLPGIGPKVADCICLFALDKDEAVPIDTHTHRVGVRLFRPDLGGRSLTPAVYEALAAAYRERFGRFAGWAQQYLFFGELSRSRSRSGV